MRALGLTTILPILSDYDYIFACKSSTKSDRPLQTIDPTAKLLSMKINDNYADDEYKDLVKHIFEKEKYHNKKLLICWHHGTIPKLLEHFHSETPYNPKWPEDVFDRIIKLQFDEHGTTMMVNLPQCLLFGDSKS